MRKVESGRISIKSMEFYGYHGCLPQERESGQAYFVDADFFIDLEPAALSDDLSLTVNYGDVYTVAGEVIGGEKRNLIETLAYDIASRLMDLYHPVKVAVRVRKPVPPLGGFAEYAEAEIVLS